MSTNVTWDYTKLADAYLKRPDYAGSAIDEMLKMAGLSGKGDVCDVGAGVGHLTIELGKRGLRVEAVEPNDAMRAHGTERTKQWNTVQWFKGTGEETGRTSSSFDLVTFGSSFNVTDRPKALAETKRILRPRGWFACMWNHRELQDPLQSRIEAVIAEHVPEYKYGTRREDQTAIIDTSQLFGPVTTVEGRVTHQQSKADCVEAWRSHATLHRQAKDKFEAVIADIEQLLAGVKETTITIPYTTKIWIAQLR